MRSMGLIQDAARAAERTPETRNRHVDLLRVVAIALVVVGHWLVIDVDITPEGPTGSSVLGRLDWAHWLTWGFQVIPVFFLVGGYANTVSWTRRVVDGDHWAAWLRRRSVRLLWPTAVFVSFGVAIMVAAQASGVTRAVLDQAAWAITFILWFLAVYVVVTAATPLMVRWYDSIGPWSMAALAAGAVAVDLARFGAGWELVGWANYAFVWGLFHQLGIAWRRGWLDRGRSVPIALGSVVVLVTLVAAGWYPVSMVTVPGAELQNTAPPTVALLAHGLALSAIAVAVEPSTRSILHDDRIWKLVVVSNAFVMSIFLWHVIPVIAVAGILDAASVRLPGPVGSAEWLAFRPVWVGVLAALFVPIVAIVARFESPPEPLQRLAERSDGGPIGSMLALVGVGATSAGLAVLALEGLWPVGGSRAPLIGLAAFGLGFGLVMVGGGSGGP